jgi:XFP N-terminal domain
MPEVLSQSELEPMHAYWRAANYLSVGQIYFLDNPLLQEPLTLAHIKPRLLGHWGTTPGLNFVYVHLNRVIKKYHLDMSYICGPGHGGPGMVGNTYLDGTYSEVYPNISQDAEGIHKLFKQFSFPGGIPSHAAPETPGSIHEGGSLATPSRTHMGRPSTTLTSSSPTWWGTVRPKPVPWPQPGTRTSFLTRSPMVPCFPFCTSTGTKLPIRPCWPASAMRNWKACSLATGTSPTLSKALTRKKCIS